MTTQEQISAAATFNHDGYIVECENIELMERYNSALKEFEAKEVSLISEAVGETTWSNLFDPIPCDTDTIMGRAGYSARYENGVFYLETPGVSVQRDGNKATIVFK